MKGIRDLETWVEAFGPAVLRLARAYLADAHEAEDVFQEVFLRALREAARLREPAAARVWLLRIAANLCRDRLRSWRWRHLRLYPPDALPEPVGEQLPASDGALRRLVLALPVAEREAVVLHYLEDLDVRTVARVLGIREGAVKTRLHRARQRLREAIGRDG